MTSENRGFFRSKNAEEARSSLQGVTYRSFWLTVERCFNWPNLFTVVKEGGSSLALAEGNNRARDRLVRDLSTHP